MTAGGIGGVWGMAGRTSLVNREKRGFFDEKMEQESNQRLSRAKREKNNLCRSSRRRHVTKVGWKLSWRFVDAITLRCCPAALYS
jgi:hypothetical protein